MSPLRWDVLVVSILLALPLIALGLRGDLTTDEVTSRLPWCFAAGWGVVALLRAVVAPAEPDKPARPAHEAHPTSDPATEGEPAPST